MRQFKIRVLWCGQEIDHWVTIQADEYYAIEEGQRRIYDDTQITVEEVKEE